MDKTIPEVIKKIMDEEEYNSCSSFEYDGETYYSLGNVSEDGFAFCEGLPVIYFIQNGTPVLLPSESALNLLSKLPDDE